MDRWTIARKLGEKFRASKPKSSALYASFALQAGPKNQFFYEPVVVLALLTDDELTSYLWLVIEGKVRD